MKDDHGRQLNDVRPPVSSSAIDEAKEDGIRAQATSVVATAWARRALESRRVREWIAWRRYLIATRISSGLAAYPRREEDAWAELLADLAAIDSSQK